MNGAPGEIRTPDLMRGRKLIKHPGDKAPSKASLYESRMTCDGLVLPRLSIAL